MASASSARPQARSALAGRHLRARPRRAQTWRILVQGNVVVQPGRGEGADRWPGDIGEPLQVANVTQALVPAGRSAGSVTGRRPGPGVGLDQLAPVVDADQPGVGAHVDPLADEAAGHRVQRPGHLDVVITVDLWAGVSRQVIREHLRRQQPGRFLEGEQLGGPAPGSPVDPLPGPPGAQACARACASARPANAVRSRRRSCRGRTAPSAPPGARRLANPRRVDANPRSWAYSVNARFSLGSVGWARSTIAAMLSGMTAWNTPP